MKLKRLAAVAAATVLALSACGTPLDDPDTPDPGPGTDGGVVPGSAVTVGWNQPFFAYNTDTSNTRATANSIITYMMRSSFNHYNPDLELVPDPSFGTYELLSDDPLVVEYTFADTAKWSDGTPVDAADLLIQWAANGGHLNTIEAADVERDADTNYPVLNGEVYFDTSGVAMALVTQTPEISDDGKTITFTYDEPYADWEIGIDVEVPAHVTAMRALDIDDPQAAKDALVAAINDNDTEALSAISEFWNSGFNYKSLPEDELLYLSSGPYLMTEFREAEYITLKYNPEYEGAHQPSIETITVRWNEDPMSQAQALENGELDLFAPQATADLLAALQNIEFAELHQGIEGVYEHIDLTFDNNGPFDPATYDGDEETALKVRQAFLYAVPREEIVEKLIRPLVPDAEVRHSQLIAPGAPGYDEVVEASGVLEYEQQDIAKAQALLEEAGVSTPIDVRVLFAEGNVRRENEFEIMQPALAEAGFNLINESSPDWGSMLGSGVYDASFFGWQSTSTAVAQSNPTYQTGGVNNLSGYSNPEVDALFDELAITPDADAQLELQKQIEKILVDDAYGLTIFQFPAIAAWNAERITNVAPSPISPTIFYGFWNWEIPSE